MFKVMTSLSFIRTQRTHFTQRQKSITLSRQKLDSLAAPWSPEQDGGHATGQLKPTCQPGCSCFKQAAWRASFSLLPYFSILLQ
jgi:hypothetical protein